MRPTVFILSFISIFLFTVPASAQVMRGVTSSVGVTEQDIIDAGELGANVIRYPLYTDKPEDYMTESAYYAWLDRALDRLDDLMPAFEQAGVKVIISMHMPPGGAYLQKGQSVYRLFSEAWTQQAIVVAWDTIARRYATNPNVWGYDTLNEPQVKKVVKGLKDWNKIASDIAYAIRAVDSAHYIIIESIYGNPSLISKLKVIPLPGIVYSVHMYYPLSFQHQGLYGNKMGIAYPTKKLNKKHLAKILKPVVTFAKKKRVPIYIGEFSAIRWAPGGSAYSYLADTLDIMEQNGWHWTYHAFREANAWSVEHTSDYYDHNPAASMTDREMLLRQYFNRN